MIGLLAQFFLFTKELQLLVSYIHNNSFPQPLSEEEEAKYLQLWENYRDLDARGKLITHNMRLVAHISKKYESTGEDQEDLISIGMIGLIKGVETFKTSKGTKLATYAARCIENEILMYLRATKRSRSELYLLEPIGMDKEGNEITLMDTLPTDEDSVTAQVESLMEHYKLFELLDVLTKRERLVLALRYGLVDGVRSTQREIARELKISRSYVSRIEKRAVQKLLRAYAAEIATKQGQ